MSQSPIKRFLLTTPAIVGWIVLILIIIALYFVAANQITPYSSRATIYARVIGISPEVSGHVVATYTTLKNQFVPKDKVLYAIDPKPYALKVAVAKNRLIITRERVATLSLQINDLAKAVASKAAALKKAKQNFDRYNQLFNDNAVSQKMTQDAQDNLQMKQADYDQALIALKQAKSNLGETINGVNVHVRLAKAQLNLAKYYLNQTQVRAPSAGYYENLYIHKGDYVEPNKTKVPFILANTWWIEGLVPQNGLTPLTVGQPALVVLDLYPGHVFHATVTSIGHGVQVKAIKPTGDLPEYDNNSAWFEPQQLFPFGVNINHDALKTLKLRVGSTASIVVLKSHNSIWNDIAAVVMWFKSVWVYL